MVSPILITRGLTAFIYSLLRPREQSPPHSARSIVGEHIRPPLGSPNRCLQPTEEHFPELLSRAFERRRGPSAPRASAGRLRSHTRRTLRRTRRGVPRSSVRRGSPGLLRRPRP